MTWNRSNPLNRDVLFFADLLHNGTDAVKGRAATYFGDGAFERNRQGIYKSGGSAGDNGASWAHDADMYPTTGYTVALVINMLEDAPTGGSDNDTFLEKSFTSAAEPFYQFQMKRSRSGAGGQLSYQIAIGGTRYGGDLSGGEAKAGRYAIAWALVDGRQTLRAYGLDTGSYHAADLTNSGTPNVYNTTLDFGDSVLAQVGYQDHVLQFLGTYGHAWTADEARSFIYNPWQVYRPRRTLIPIGAPASAVSATLGGTVLTGTPLDETHIVAGQKDGGNITIELDLIGDTWVA